MRVWVVYCEVSVGDMHLHIHVLPLILCWPVSCLFLQVFPALLMVMGVFECPRLQAHACAALVNFVELCPKGILSKYLDGIVAKLEEIFQIVLKEVSGSGRLPTYIGGVAEDS